MKIKIVKYLLIGISLLSCNPGKKVTSPVKNDPVALSSGDTSNTHSPGDGKSYETAVIIQEISESAGIHAEYQWIRDHYSNYKVVQQSLNYHGKRPFDVITIQFADKRKQEIYFDISKFFK
jgi:hypothetical protein